MKILDMEINHKTVSNQTLTATIKKFGMWKPGCQFLSKKEKWELLYGDTHTIYRKLNEKIKSMNKSDVIIENEYGVKIRNKAVELINKYLSKEWKFTWSNKKTVWGTCYHNKKIIELSYYMNVINNREYEFVVDTILHEIAHAMTPGQNHNKVWKEKCIELGCVPSAYSNDTEIKKKFRGICPNCGYIIFKHKRTDTACKKCCKKYNNGNYSDEFKFIWKLNEHPY